MRPPSVAPPPNSNRPKPLSPTSLRLSSIDFGLASAARHVVESALALVPGDRLVVVHDEARTPLAHAVIGATEDLGAHVESLVLEAIEPRPIRAVPAAIRRALGQAEAALLIIGTDDGEGGLALEMAALASTLGLRYGQMIGAGRSGMIAGFSVERGRIADAVRALRARLRPGGIIRLRSPAGSDLEVHLPLDVRWTEHNAPVRIGRAEPLPAASVTSYVARIRGTFVADASCGSAVGASIGSLAGSPVRLEIEGGICRAIRCKDGALERSLDSLVRSEPLLQRVGAIHFGAHVGLLDATGEIGCDLTLPGLHLSLGTRTSQDGAPFTTRTEIGFAGRSSDVDVDGVPLVRAGRVLSQ